MNRADDWITPSGIAEFSYCEKAWDLKRCGQAAPVTKQMKRGIQKHEQKAMAVGASSMLFVAAALFGVILLLAAFFLRSL